MGDGPSVTAEPDDRPSRDIDPQDYLKLRFSGALRAMLRRRLGDSTCIEEALHEACRIVTEKLRDGGLQDESNVISFLHQTAVQIAIDQRRRAIRRKTDAASDVLDTLPGETPEPFQTVEREQHAAAVRALLKELPRQRDRLLLIRLYLDEADKDDLCAEFGLSAEHFDRVISRARQRFREILERAGFRMALSFALLCSMCPFLSYW
jgi:RNA polymerase sigma-70 factor (ECF subfamily)